MLDNLFRGIFDTEATSVIQISDFLLCVGCALVIGLILAACYIYQSQYTKSFVTTLALIPAVVCVVIMMVNGNVGTGVAVAGAFSLVRFRSAAGSAKEIGAIFLAMTAGLIVGMGYLAYAFLCAVVLGLASVALSRIDFGMKKRNSRFKTLHITIPEDLDYTDVFEPILDEYATNCELVQVKTTNLGSLFRLSYNLRLKNEGKEKELIDKLRCRNGNLEITVSRQETVPGEL